MKVNCSDSTRPHDTPKKVANNKKQQNDLQAISGFSPWKLTYPLKNDGWKMHFLLQ